MPNNVDGSTPLNSESDTTGPRYLCIAWRAKLTWHVVKEFAAKIGVNKLAPQGRRSSCARLCRAAGGELAQIQFILGNVSVQTTERYLGCAQRISSAVNDGIGIKPKT